MNVPWPSNIDLYISCSSAPPAHTKGGWDQTTLRNEADLVNLLGISGKDCESEDLKGKKCFVVGVHKNSTCAASKCK